MGCEGITLAARWPDIPMTLETDCAWIADSLKNQRHDLSINWSTLREARMKMEELCRLDIVKISRSQINAAHRLAHFAIRSSCSEVFFNCFPEFVVSIVCKDTI
jgi:hypothetical protein